MRIHSAIVQSFPQRIARVQVEDRLNLGRRFVGEINQGTPTGNRHQHRGGPLLDRQFNQVERVVDRLDRAAEVQSTDNRKPPLQRPVEKCLTERRKRWNTKVGAALPGIKRSKLDSEFVLARIAVPD